MKRILLSGLALVIGFAVMAQTAQLKKGVVSVTNKMEQKVAFEPTNNNVLPVATKSNGNQNSDNPDVVSVITLGTSANGYGYGYAGGQKTMVWADDTLKAIINIHRMGPGSTPPSLSGYLGIDLGVNMGMTSGDWTNNWQIYAAVLNNGGDYYVDAARYPQGAIYSPYKNTSVSNAYVHYFAPNLSNTLSTWGAYSYGSVSLANQADSTKTLYWYAPPPYTYIPDGFTLTQDGIALVTDLDQNWESGTMEYQGNIILHRGVWNSTLNDFEYDLNTVISLPTKDNGRPANQRIAASPDGKTVWIVAITNNDQNIPIPGGPATYYPVLFKSNDGGITWSDPINVQLDGSSGLAGIVEGLFTDYRLELLYGSPIPPRDEIPYTTAFDCDIVVDKWGNPHVGVVVGTTSDDYSISTSLQNSEPPDSLFCVYDIYSTDGGTTWNAVKMGTPWTFRGAFADLTEDNRVNMTINEAGDIVVCSWIDTQIPQSYDNISPDVYARGFNLLTNMITNNNGNDEPQNVTFLSDVTQESYFACASHYLFTDGADVIVPIVVEVLSDPTDPAQSVTFKYIPDFKYSPSQFTIPVGNSPFPVAIDNKKAENVSLNIYPNPVKNTAKVNLTLSKTADVQVLVTNMVGQNVLSMNKGTMKAGANQFTLDASALNSGVYFVTVIVDGQKTTTKLVVE